jgi:hypothetical protein
VGTRVIPRSVATDRMDQSLASIGTRILQLETGRSGPPASGE